MIRLDTTEPPQTDRRFLASVSTEAGDEDVSLIFFSPSPAAAAGLDGVDAAAVVAAGLAGVVAAAAVPAEGILIMRLVASPLDEEDDDDDDDEEDDEAGAAGMAVVAAGAAAGVAAYIINTRIQIGLRPYYSRAALIVPAGAEGAFFSVATASSKRCNNSALLPDCFNPRFFNSSFICTPFRSDSVNQPCCGCLHSTWTAVIDLKSTALIIDVLQGKSRV